MTQASCSQSHNDLAAPPTLPHHAYGHWSYRHGTGTRRAASNRSFGFVFLGYAILLLKWNDSYCPLEPGTSFGPPVIQLPNTNSMYNQSMLMDAVYQPVGEGFISVKCAAGGKYPFFVTEGRTIKWVCKNIGEKKVTAVMVKVFANECSKSPDSPGLMLDIGSNLGYYGILAMRLGCKAILFDLQPGCQKRINNAIIVNQFVSLGKVAPFGVSNTEGSFRVPNEGCDGRFPASAHERGSYDQGNVMAHVYPLTKFIGENQPILLVKVDTEGNEKNVLEGMMPYLSKRLVKNVVVEVTPGHHFWDHLNITVQQVAETFATIVDYGYTMMSLHDFSIHNSSEGIYHYISNAPFTQTDLWITSNDVSAADIEEIKAGLGN